MSRTLFRSGELVYHPRFGFGTILSVTQQDVDHLMGGDTPGTAEDYYEIGLFESGTLLVPVARVDSVGLRRLTNGLNVIRACLASPPGYLPADSRQRFAGLRACEQAREPDALLHAVRDLAALARDRSLTGAEQKWMDQACRRLGTEAALVDEISESEARAAIWQVVEGLRSTRTQ